MPAWITRALGTAVLHAAATVAVAKIDVFRPTDTTLVTVVALALLVGTAALWGALDSWLGLDRAARAWFIAGLVAGPVSGVLATISKNIVVDQTGVSELGSALTGGAAFTALLVLVPAWIGVFVGQRLGATRSRVEEDEPEAGADEVPV